MVCMPLEMMARRSYIACQFRRLSSTAIVDRGWYGVCVCVREREREEEEVGLVVGDGAVLCRRRPFCLTSESILKGMFNP